MKKFTNTGDVRSQSCFTSTLRISADSSALRNYPPTPEASKRPRTSDHVSAASRVSKKRDGFHAADRDRTNRRDGRTMVPFSRSKRKFPIMEIKLTAEEQAR